MTYDEHQLELSSPSLDATTNVTIISGKKTRNRKKKPANNDTTSSPKKKLKPGKKQTGTDEYMATCEDKVKQVDWEIRQVENLAKEGDKR